MTKKSEIIKIDHTEYGLEEKKAAQIQAVFEPMLAKMVELEKEYNGVIAMDVSFDTCAKAKEVRLKYVKVRTETAKIHKEIKAFYLNGGRFVDGWKNAQLFASQGIEEKLESIEKYYERKEEKRKVKLAEERLALLELYEVETEHIDLGGMDDALWNNYFKGVQATDKEEKEAAAKAETIRVAEEEAQAQKVSRINQLSGMGMIWIDALDHYEKDEKTVSKEAVLTLDNDEFEMVVTAVAFKLKKAKKEIEDQAKKDKKKADQEAEKTIKKAENDAKVQAVKNAEKEAKAKEAAAKKEAVLAPDKEKLNVLADTIRDLELPSVSSDEAQSIIDEIDTLLDKTVNHLVKRIETL